MSKVIGTWEGEDVTLHADGSITFRAKFAVDTDGCGPMHGDPDGQDDTSLHYQGKPLNADIDKYIVLPPGIITAVPGIVLGCKAHVLNTRTDMDSDAVVGDVGPHKRIGEGSVALANTLGIDPSPVSGGEEDHVCEYTVQPGVVAYVDGTLYELQPYRA